MRINADFSIVNRFQMPKRAELLNFQETNLQTEYKSIVLPDIRSNQILLPDNKIYVPSYIKSDFNRNHLSIQLPSNYKKVEEVNEDKNTKTAKSVFKKYNSVSLYENIQTGAKIIRASKNDYTKEGLFNSSEVLEIDMKNPKKATRYIKDYEHNSETEITISNPLSPRETTTDSMTTIYRDKNGSIIKTEEYKKSVIPGLYDITETDAAGNKTIISKAAKDEEGNILVEKNLVSLDGTKTTYRYESDKEGNHKKLFTQITDSNGKVLSTIDRTYDKESENVTYSSVNGNKYKAERKDNSLEITNYTNGEITVIKPEDKKASESEKNSMMFTMLLSGRMLKFTDENVLDKMFDTFPADTLLTLNSNITKIFPLEDDLDSAFVGSLDYLMCKTDNFVVNHELGHSKDATRAEEGATLYNAKKPASPLANNEQFRKTYIEEKAAFMKEFPDFEEKFIGYFLFGVESKPERGRKETVAETNAINGLQPQPPELLAMRTTLLQRYFPRSIAEITKLTTPIAMIEENKAEEDTKI